MKETTMEIKKKRKIQEANKYEQKERIQIMNENKEEKDREEKDKEIKKSRGKRHK